MEDTQAKDMPQSKEKKLDVQAKRKQKQMETEVSESFPCTSSPGTDSKSQEPIDTSTELVRVITL